MATIRRAVVENRIVTMKFPGEILHRRQTGGIRDPRTTRPLISKIKIRGKLQIREVDIAFLPTAPMEARNDNRRAPLHLGPTNGRVRGNEKIQSPPLSKRGYAAAICSLHLADCHSCQRVVTFIIIRSVQTPSVWYIPSWAEPLFSGLWRFWGFGGFRILFTAVYLWNLVSYRVYHPGSGLSFGILVFLGLWRPLSSG